MNTNYVYFATYGGRGPIKIGISCAPEVRLRDWGSGLPYAPILLGMFSGSHKDERALHLRFAHLRLRGEWFRRAPELMVVIAQHRDRKLRGVNTDMRISKRYDLDKKTALRLLRNAAKTDTMIAKWAGCSRQAVGTWRRIPAGRVLRLEKIPEIGLTRYQMRPDIYGSKP